MSKSVKDIYIQASKFQEITEDDRECIRFVSSVGIANTSINFKENTQYTFSFDGKAKRIQNNELYNDCIFCIRYTDGTNQALYPTIDNVWRNLKCTSTAGKTIKNIGVLSYHWQNWLYIDINTFQIEEGATATEYEPYVDPVRTNIYLKEPLRKVGVYADYIDFKENKVVRKTVKQVFNSSIPAGEAVAAWQREGHYCCVCDSALKVAGIREVKAYSNRFKQGNWTWSGNSFPSNYFYHAHNDRNLHVIINKQYLDGITNESTSAEKIAAFKAFFDKYETYLIYPRKTPIEEPLNIDLPKLTAKTTIIEVDTNLAPSNAYGKYIKK